MKQLNKFLLTSVLALACSGLAQAAAFSDYVENKVVDHIFRATSYTAAATDYVGLSTAACSDSSVGTEVTGGSYARVSVTAATTAWKGTHGTTTGASSGTSGTITNAAAVNFPTPSAGWGTATHWFISDASTAGNLLVCAALTTSKTINSGDTVSFAIDAISIQADN
jgi:opacity protein-like surface antigen